MANKIDLLKSYVTPNPEGCIDRRDAMNNHLAIKSALECFCELILTHGVVEKVKEVFSTTGSAVAYELTEAIPLNDSGDYDYVCIELFQNGLRVGDVPCRDTYFRIDNGVLGVYTTDSDGNETDVLAGTAENPCCWVLKYHYTTPFADVLECIGKTNCSC